MIKTAWGTKRQCFTCSAKFYDLGRTPIVCPKCQTTMNIEALFKARRKMASLEPEDAVIVEMSPLEESLLIDDPLEEVDIIDGDETPLMEDTEDLEGSDDMAEVIDHREKDEDH